MPYSPHFTATLAVLLAITSHLPNAAGQQASENPNQAEISQRVAIVRSDASDFEKITACKRLALIGDKTAIPAVAPLLASEQLSHAARLVLEAVGGPEATAALRAALPNLTGRPLVGAINSLGILQDAEAVELLAAKLTDSDAEVVAAASATLGRIGTPNAVQFLLKATPGAPAALRPHMADACMVCAEQCLADDDRQQAIAIFDQLAAMDLPEPSKLAAIRGSILTRQEAGIEPLAKELKSDDASRFALALTVSHELPASKVAQAVAGLLGAAPPQRQMALLTLLESLGDASAQASVLQLLQSPDAQVRAAAIRSLSALGDAATLAVLYQATSDPDATVAAAARDTLITMKHPDVDAAVMGMFQKAEGDSRLLLLDLLGQRRIVAAIPLMEKAADDSNASVRSAAIRALGQATDVAHLPLLVARLTKAENSQDQAAVHAALRSACSRLPNKQGCAEKLTAALGEASPPVKCLLIDVLGVVGDSNALAAVAAGVADSNAQVRDAATRVLGNWPNAEAAPALLKAATELPDDNLRIRSLRGYIRIARQLDMGDGQRLQMCQKAMEAAGRDDERILVLDACTRIPNEASLAFVVSHADNPALRKAAGAAAVSIAERIVSAAPQAAAKAVQKIMPALEDPDLIRRGKEVLDKGADGAKK